MMRKKQKVGTLYMELKTRTVCYFYYRATAIYDMTKKAKSNFYTESNV